MSIVTMNRFAANAHRQQPFDKTTRPQQRLLLAANGFVCMKQRLCFVVICRVAPSCFDNFVAFEKTFVTPTARQRYFL